MFIISYLKDLCMGWIRGLGECPGARGGGGTQLIWRFLIYPMDPGQTDRAKGGGWIGGERMVYLCKNSAPVGHPSPALLGCSLL